MSAKGGYAFGGNYEFFMNLPKTGQHGYIALTSVIIVSLLLITVTMALGAVNYFGRYNILENEYKERSSGLAEDCVDYVLGKLAANPAYIVASSQTVALGSDVCDVVSVTSQSGQAIIKTRGYYPQNTPLKSYTNLLVFADSTFNVVNRQETPN